jgi:hypothetical protein
MLLGELACGSMRAFGLGRHGLCLAMAFRSLSMKEFLTKASRKGYHRRITYA